MKYIQNKLDALAIKAKVRMMNFANDESGMEIIQVLILLALGLGIIALFMTFSKQITDAVSEKVADFMANF